MIEELKKWIDEISTNPVFFLFLLLTDDPRWVIFCRLVMWVSVLSLIPILTFQFHVAVPIVLLATTSAIPVHLYERKKMREWLKKEQKEWSKEEKKNEVKE